MNLTEYQGKAIRTLAKLESTNLDLAHVTLGLGSELFELAVYVDEINRLEEIGDMLWYLAGYCHLRGTELSDFYEYPTDKDIAEKIWRKSLLLDTLNKHVFVLQDMVKKQIAYNSPIDIEKEKLVLKTICRYLSIYGGVSSEKRLSAILTMNINKLICRYPERFTDDLANNRDLEREYRVLSSK